ncbi:adenosylmethionine decarboxylase [Pseudomonas sp. RC10]|uniref:adenosylmethionine decarboxylase n=1 Tax=Pseudomonas bambusae TaxID=3139142 RepID=UPI003139E9AD
MDDLGNHTILDIVGADAALLKNAHALHDFFLNTLERSSFNVINHLTHKFISNGEGVTGLYLLSESHLSYHTYPENCYISVDVYTCGTKKLRLKEELKIFFGNEIRIAMRTLVRGSEISLASLDRENT